MPRLNDGGAATDGRQVCWYDQVRTISQICEGGVCRLVLSDGTPIVTRGANDLVASGMRNWAAFLHGYGVYDSYGQRFPDSALGVPTMSAGGWYARKVSYNSYGPWVLQGNDTEIPLTQRDLDYGYVHLSGVSDAVWTEGGRLRSNVTVRDPGVPIWWPVLVEGMLLCQEQARGRLVLDGRVIAPAGNYFYPDAKLVNGRIVVTWSPNQGDAGPQVRTLTYDELRACPLLADDPAIPDPPTPPEPHMDLNDPKYLVAFSTLKAERSKLPETITSAQAGALLNAVALAHAGDGWGMLAKPGGNHAPVPGTSPTVYVSSDWLVNKNVGLGVDCLGSGPDFDPPANGAATPQWGAGEAFDAGRFVPPAGAAPEPQPAGTHVYVGGGSDTGTCDLCGASRFDAVHAVPQSKVAHTYDGGEQDTGLCDICQKPQGDGIHSGATPPPPPPAGDDVAELRAAIKRLEAADENTLATLATATGEFARIGEEIKALDRRIDAIKTSTEVPEYTQEAGGRFLGHRHRIR